MLLLRLVIDIETSICVRLMERSTVVSKLLDEITADLREMERAKSDPSRHCETVSTSRLNLQQVSDSVNSILKQRAEERAMMQDLSFGEY